MKRLHEKKMHDDVYPKTIAPLIYLQSKLIEALIDFFDVPVNCLLDTPPCVQSNPVGMYTHMLSTSAWYLAVDMHLHTWTNFIANDISCNTL